MAVQGRRIVVGVTGGIAAYKAAELVSRLRQEDAEVQVVMTDNARQFVTPLTFSTLSGRRVYTETFPDTEEHQMWHISLAEWGELLAVVPATANFIAKAAAGIADDLLSTVLVSFEGPKLLAPAMNRRMYQNQVVRRNLQTLERMGFHLLPAKEGALACGESGPGRLPEPEEIIMAIDELLNRFPR